MGVSMLALIWLNSHLITGGVLSSFSSTKNDTLPQSRPPVQRRQQSRSFVLFSSTQIPFFGKFPFSNAFQGRLKHRLVQEDRARVHLQKQLRVFIGIP